MKMNCLFCSIISGDIPSKKIFEDETVYAFYDINPQAPVHFLVIPKQHIDSAAEITSGNSTIVAHVFEVIAQLAKELSLENGYRVITNCGSDGAQSVKHLHFHVLGGKRLSEKMA
jgi:histidine triad (HIT) family protein